MIRSIPPRKSMPSSKWRFIGGNRHRQNSGNASEDTEKDMNEFKRKLRERGNRKGVE